jgi:hypothetical protein
MRSLSFEFTNGSWFISLHGRDKPIGDIFPLPDGEWFGHMSLDGYDVGEVGARPQIIIDAFAAWVAAGMPKNTPMLNRLVPLSILETL